MGGMRRISWWLAVLLCTAWTLPAVAQGFHIERITILNNHRSPAAILREEMRLKENQVYSEADLSHAHHRLMRLPFIWKADFALRKGSQRGSYVLEVTVTEAKRFFWIWYQPTSFLRDDYFSEADPPPDHDKLGDFGQDAGLALGWQWFTKKGELRFALPALVSYTHYGLGASHLIGNITVGPAPNIVSGGAYNGRSPIPMDGRLSHFETGLAIWTRGSLSLPLRRTQMVTLAVTASGGELLKYRRVGTAFEDLNDSSSRLFETSLDWSMDTTNHPTFMTRGWFVQGGINSGLLTLKFGDEDAVIPDNCQEAKSMGWFSHAHIYHEIGPEQSLGLALFANQTRFDIKNRPRNGSELDLNYTSSHARLEVSWARNHLGRVFFKKPRDFRYSVHVGVERNEGDLGDVIPEQDYTRSYVEAAIMGADGRGLVRFSLRYSTTNQELWP